MFEFLTDNLLIVCPNSYKLAILKYLEEHKLILNIKFMTKLEYLKAIKFDYDIKSIHYLTKKGMKVDNAITILDNLYYIEENDYHNEKLNYLVQIKKELDNHNLLIYDNLFKKMLKRKVIVYGYGKLNSFDNKLFSNNEVIPYPENDKKYDVYHFKSIKEEVEFVFQKIGDLLKNGIDINKISIMNVDIEYFPYFKMMEKFYDIKIDINNSDTLMGTIIGKKFYELIKEGKNVDEIVSQLSIFSSDLEYPNIINLLNKYSECNLGEYLKEIEYDLLNTKVKNKEYYNVVHIKNVFDYISDDEYVFCLNFNSSMIPKLKMDTNYITNDITSLVGLAKIEDENELIKVNTLNYLSSINHLIISYKDQSPFNEYHPSILFDYMSYQEKEYERSLNYSDLANKSLYAMYLDDYLKYGMKNKNMDILYSKYDKNNYLEYHNDYTGINPKGLMEYLNNELSLSYSSIDNFYKCRFRYYLNDILKINVFEKKFSATIGNAFHHVLSKMNDKDFDMKRVYQEYFRDYELDNKEKFFVDKLEDDLAFCIEVIRKHEFISGFTNMLYEHKVDIKLMDSPYVHFKGYIDKIMYQEKDGETLVSIIDYKTGNTDIRIKNLEFGLSMQLPVYLYLAKNISVLKNIRFAGFYLQHILDIDVKKVLGKSIDEEKENNLKLTGFSNGDPSILSVFDSTYEKSSMIKGIKLNKDGSFPKNASVLSDSDIDSIINLTHEKIMEAVNSIMLADFLINPKILNKKNVSCEHCDFKDICYHTEKDFVYLANEEDHVDKDVNN